MKVGIETHQWGFFQVGDSRLIATCIAKTYFEAVSYFEDEHLILDADSDLILDALYEVKIIK
jgi:hypothetical protein